MNLDIWMRENTACLRLAGLLCGCSAHFRDRDRDGQAQKEDHFAAGAPVA